MSSKAINAAAAAAGDDDDEFTIRVTGEIGVGDGGGRARRRRFDVRLRPSMTYDELRKRVVDEFFGEASSSPYDVSILVGFPPRAMTPIAPSSIALRDLGIRPNESAIARFVPSTSTTSTVGGGEGSNDPTTMAASRTDDAVVGARGRDDDGRCKDNDVDGPRRGKRASALAATANFKDAIAAQDAAMREGRSTTAARRGGGDRPDRRCLRGQVTEGDDDGGGRISSLRR